MVNVIRPDPLSLAAHHLHAYVLATEEVLASSTGFIFAQGGHHYLITNWHNVTGVDPNTGLSISSVGAFPSALSTVFRLRGKSGNWVRESLPLYADSLMLEPLWLEHPEYGSKVDVVALQLPQDLQQKYDLYAINRMPMDDGIALEVADEAFVIGFPFSEPTHIALPIWKKASIASEPTVNIDQLPKMLIDTATRPGLSGSPVIMQRVGIHGMRDGKLAPDTTIGRVRCFVGVYSGRIGADELKAQLGIVWKDRVISEIINGGKRGSVPAGAV